MPPTTPGSGEPEVPSDIPPEYVDAYLAGFRRAYGGELTQEAAQPVDEPAQPVAVTPEPAPPDGRDGPDSSDETRDAASDTVRQPTREGDREWLSERDKSVPLGWAPDPAEGAADAPARPPAGKSGSTSTSTETAAWRDGGRTGRSPWMVVLVFLAILLLLMLVSYIGGMAFSTIVNR